MPLQTEPGPRRRSTPHRRSKRAGAEQASPQPGPSSCWPAGCAAPLCTLPNHAADPQSLPTLAQVGYATGEVFAELADAASVEAALAKDGQPLGDVTAKVGRGHRLWGMQSRPQGRRGRA
jgi:hypothetical protein